MEVDGIEFYIDNLSLCFKKNGDMSTLFIGMFCSNTENKLEQGQLTFDLDNGQTWKCRHRDNILCNLKLGHILSDSMITKIVSEKLSKLYRVSNKDNLTDEQNTSIYPFYRSYDPIVQAIREF